LEPQIRHIRFTPEQEYRNGFLTILILSAVRWLAEEVSKA